jgi:hypothetical protein
VVFLLLDGDGQVIVNVDVKITMLIPDSSRGHPRITGGFKYTDMGIPRIIQVTKIIDRIVVIKATRHAKFC